MSVLTGKRTGKMNDTTWHSWATEEERALIAASDEEIENLRSLQKAATKERHRIVNRCRQRQHKARVV